MPVLLPLGLQHVECGHGLLGGVGDLRRELASSVVPCCCESVWTVPLTRTTLSMRPVVLFSQINFPINASLSGTRGGSPVYPGQGETAP